MSNKRAGPSEEKSLLGKLEIHDLPRDARAATLLAAYLAYGPETSHPARLRDLSLRTGMGYNALSQVSARRCWKEALQAATDAPGTLELGNTGVKAVEGAYRTFSAIQMAAGIKAYAAICNDVCFSFSRTTQKLVSLLTAQIDKKFAQYGDTLSYLETQDIIISYKQLADVMESSARYVSPAVQSQLLASVGFTASLPMEAPEDVDTHAFTVQALQARLEAMGLPTILNDAEAINAAFAPYAEIMPQIEGTR